MRSQAKTITVSWYRRFRARVPASASWLRRVEEEQCRSLVIEKRGMPKAVLLSIRDYVKLAAPEPEVLRLLGEESQRKGTDKLTSRQIDQAIKSARAEKSKRG